MAKNPRRQERENAAAAQRAEGKKNAGASVSRRGKKVIGIGVGIVVLGFWILTYSDPAGQNWASTLSPALLVLGYGLIGVGIVLPDPSVAASSPLPPPT